MKKILVPIFMSVIMLLSTVKAMAQVNVSPQTQATGGLATKKGMIKVTVLYPGGEGKKFDMDYYTNKHIPMVKNLFAGTLKLAAYDKGLAGGAAGAPAPFVLICYLYFDSVSDFQNAMAANGSKVKADIANFTNIVPVIQIGEVVE